MTWVVNFKTQLWKHEAFRIKIYLPRMKITLNFPSASDTQLVKCKERLAAEMVRDSRQYSRKGLRHQETKNASLSFFLLFHLSTCLHTAKSIIDTFDTWRVSHLPAYEGMIRRRASGPPCCIMKIEDGKRTRTNPVLDSTSDNIPSSCGV